MPRWYGLRRLLFFGFLFLVVLALGQATRGGENARAAAEDPAPSALLPDPNQVTAGLAEGHQNYLEELSRREQELAQPQAVAARLHSRSAYVDLSAAEAQQLAFSTFAGTFAELDEDPARFLSDARLDKVVESDAATVTSEGDTQLLEAGMPVEAKDEEGDLGKVDLGVVPAEDGWELENPLVEVEVGESAAEGITLPEAGVTVVQAGAEESAPRLEDGSDLFFPEVEEGTDTDLIVSPIAHGVELFDVLRSPASPETLRFQLQVPAGAELRPGPAGSAEVVADGEVSVHVPKPWARDAQGTEVPVEMTVEGNSLVLAVDHRDQDLAYPILVDPTIYQDWGWWYNGQNLQGLGAFYFQTSAGGWWAHGTYADPGGFPGYDNKGLFVWSDPGNLGSDQWGQWVRPAPTPGSFIAAATINPFWRYDNPCNDPTRDYQPYDYSGMWNGQGGVTWNELRFNDAKNQNYTTLSTKGRALIFGLSTDWRGRVSPCYRHLMAGGIGIWLDDEQNPSVSIGLPTGWLKKDGTARSLSVSAADAGLGVQSVAMTSPASIGWNQPWCAGTYDNPCAGSRSGTIGFTTSGYAEGAVGVTVQVTDPTAKKGSASGTIYVDGTAPTLSLSGSSTATTHEVQIDANDGGPGVPRSGVKEVKVYLDGQLKQTKTGTCSTAGCGASLSFKYSQSLVGLSQGSHTVEVVATDQVGYTKSSQTTFEIKPPDTVIDSGPEGLTKTDTPTFTYHSTVAGSTFQCRVDTGAWVSCPATGYTTSKLAEGPHTFEVKATSGIGLVDPTPAKREFTVLGPPDTTIVFGPKGTTNAKRPTFGYRSNNTQAWFECKLDSSAYVPCGPATYETLEGHPGQVLAEGAHTVSVRAVNQLGVADPTPAVASFTVDATAPKAEITSGPEGPTNEAKPTFNFNASGGSVACFLEAEGEPETEEGEPPFAPCTTSSSYTPATNLPEGSYEFRLRAQDGAMNETEDARAFSVDTTAPDTTITSAPPAIADDATPTIEFSSSEAEATFQCRYDAEAFRACSGPGGTDTPATALAAGAHTFQVRAVDGAGNADATPATAAFALLTAGPQTSIDSGPDGAIGGTEATFTYSTDETASMECSLDGAAFSSCATTGRTYTGLSEGEHVFEVRGKNGAAVADPTPARRAFVVDTSAPSAPVLSGAIFEEDGYGLRFRVEASDGDPTTPQGRRSGVESVEILLDGKVVMELGAECASKICPADFVRDPQIPWQPLLAAPVGASVEARAKDGLGHISTASLEVKQPHEQAVQPTDGSGSGAFALLAAAGCPNEVEIKGPKMIGTCENDKLVPSKEITVVEALDGDDVIIGNPKTRVIKGGGGADVIRGGGGNDELRGGDGLDRIYGGNGDDKLFGDDGGDVLDGGPGEDPLKGGKGNDTLRGGQGPDTFIGGPDTDTVSFADALAPGFAEAEASNDSATTGRPDLYASAKQKAEASGIETFPPAAEAGVYIRFANPEGTLVRASAGDPAQGGGTDTFKKGENERIVGSPFGDWIEGEVAKTTIDPGPGEDMVFNAGAPLQQDDGDWVNGARGTYHPRPRPFVDAYQAGLEKNVYLIGGATASESFVAKVSDKQVRVTGAVTKAVQVGDGLGALVLYGGREKDIIKVTGAGKQRPGAILLAGGPGGDELIGGLMEELLVDGIQQTPGTVERLFGGGGEDDLAQGEGADKVEGGPDDDLFLNSRVCEGDSYYAFDANFKPGENDATKKAAKEAEDNAQFHLLPNYGVYANMQKDKLGGSGNNLEAEYKLNCGALGAETFKHFNAFEGSPQNDLVRGNGYHNYILGRGGENRLYGGGGPDTLLVNNRHPELVVDCGGGQGDGDIAHVDSKWDLGYSPPAKKLKASCKWVKKGAKYHDGQPVGRYPNLDRKLNPVGGGGKAAATSTGGGGQFSSLLTLVGEPGEEASFPTAEFHLDETTGTSAANALDEEAPATYMAKGTGPSVGGPGPVLGGESALLGEEGEEEGSSISLDGSTAYVDLNGQAGPEGGEGYSVSVYVKFTAPAGKREYLFSSAGANGRGAFLYRAPNGSIVFTTAPFFGAPAVASEPVSVGDWHQVVASLEGETISLNVDGFPYELGYNSDVMPAPALSAESLLGAGPGATDLLAGRLDQFTSYEGVPSEGEIFPMLAASRAQVAEYLPASAPEGDEDGDGVADNLDNCPADSNPDQADGNLDGIGDACQVADQDGDEVADGSDNCPTIYNPDQTDTNSDGVGDDCSSLSPEVETGGATAVKATSATIEGTVNPEGSATSYYFEYGPTTAYGTKVPLSPKAVGSGFNTVTVSQALTGLAQGTTYHYRLVAVNAAGTETGFDQTFLTLKAPKAATYFATGIGQSAATLYGGVNPEGSATSYYFEYGPTIFYGMKIPLSPKEVGAGTWEDTVSQSLTDLTPGTTYHFRLVATSAAATTQGVDRTFTTKQASPVASDLGAMAVTDPFNSTTNAVSNFGTKWSVLGWAAGKGENRTNGWGAVQAHPAVNGAYFAPTVADVGTGAAAVATVAAGPGNNFPSRYFALWLDMQTPGGARSGYQLRFVQTSLNVYEVILAKWSAGTETVLATKTGYSLAAGSSVALVDAGSSVAAWTNTGSGFTQILTAADSSFSSGNGGVEAAGNLSRLTNFKIGQLLPSAANMSAALGALRLNDAFATAELPLSGGGAWAALAWDYASANRTGRVAANEGWGPYDPWEFGEAINGAYWTKATSADTGSGDAVAATLKVRPGLPGRHFELLLNMPDPANARSGYELRFTEPTGGTGLYTVTLVKWVTGTPTTLATQTNVSLAIGGRVALVHKAGVLSAWTAGASGEFTQLLSASDTTYQSGYLGIAGGGNFARLANFRGAQLPPF